MPKKLETVVWESIALFYLGKSLHEQGTKERGYVYMLQATEMMEKSHYDRKYDNLRANCNDLLICYERDKRYGEALQVLDKLEKYLYAKTQARLKWKDSMSKKNANGLPIVLSYVPN